MKKILTTCLLAVFTAGVCAAQPIVVKIKPKNPSPTAVSSASAQAASVKNTVKKVAVVKKETPAPQAQKKINLTPLVTEFKTDPVVGKDYIIFGDKKYSMKDLSKNSEGWINEYYLASENKNDYTVKLNVFEEMSASKNSPKFAAEKYISKILADNPGSQCFLRTRTDKEGAGVADCYVKSKKGSYYSARKYDAVNNVITYVEYNSKLKEGQNSITAVKPSRESVIQALFTMGRPSVDKGEGKAAKK